MKTIKESIKEFLALPEKEQIKREEEALKKYRRSKNLKLKMEDMGYELTEDKLGNTGITKKKYG